MTWYRLEGELEGLIERSFPDPGDDEKIRAMFRASLSDDGLGIQGAAPGRADRLRVPRGRARRGPVTR